MKKLFLKLGSALSVAMAVIVSFAPNLQRPKQLTGKSDVHQFTVKTIDGHDLNLSEFKGKKMLIVNVASKCGYTPQYKSLQTLHEKYGEKLVVIGFPANNFGAQEPGSEAEIKDFCEKNYGVTFRMMEKISVKGKDMHPLYQWLSNKEENGVCDESPNWNFCKYLIDENGKIIRFYNSKVDPMSEEIISLL
jgi:glutathione peroxidase